MVNVEPGIQNPACLPKVYTVLELKTRKKLTYLCDALLIFFFSDAPPPTGQWGARRSTGGYNTRHDMFTPWAVINEDLLYAHALATDKSSTWRGNNKVEQTGSTLGLSEIRTADTPPVHIIHRQGASLSPLIHSQCQLQV